MTETTGQIRLDWSTSVKFVFDWSVRFENIHLRPNNNFFWYKTILFHEQCKLCPIWNIHVVSIQSRNNTFKTELFQQNKPYRTQLLLFFKSSWPHAKALDLRHSTSTLLQMTHLCYLSFSGSWQDGSKVNMWAVYVLPVLDSISEKELFYRVRSQYLSAMLSDLHLNTVKERYLLLVASLFSSAFTDFPPKKHLFFFPWHEHQLSVFDVPYSRLFHIDVPLQVYEVAMADEREARRRAGEVMAGKSGGGGEASRGGERAVEWLTEAPAGRRRWGGRLQREQTEGMFNHHTSVRDMSLTAAPRLDPPR